jgi:hypothetical protein
MLKLVSLKQPENLTARALMSHSCLLNKINSCVCRQQIRALGHTHQKDVERLQNMLHSWQCHSCDSSSVTTNTLEDGVSLRPIGVISTWFPEKKGTPRQAGICVNMQGKLALFNSVFTNPEHALEGLEGFSHMW